MTWVIQPWKIIVSMWVIAIVFAVIGVIVGKHTADRWYAEHKGSITCAAFGDKIVCYRTRDGIWTLDETSVPPKWHHSNEVSPPQEQKPWVIQNFTGEQPKGPTTSTGDYKCEPPGCMSTQPKGAK